MVDVLGKLLASCCHVEGLAARLAQALDICLRKAENSGRISLW